MRNAGRSLAALLAVVCNLAPATLIGESQQAPKAWTFRGRCIADAGDVNGDGVSDIAIGCPGTTESGLVWEGTTNNGYVELISGRDLSVLRVLGAEHQDGELGLALAAGQDLDGDHVPDLVVGSPTHLTAPQIGGGAALVYSGKTGKLLRIHKATEWPQKFGVEVAFVGDMDGDGVAEIAVGATRGGLKYGKAFGKVVLFSGKGGGELVSLYGTEKYGGFGSAVVGLADVDGDRVPDIAVGAPGDRTRSDVTGRVVLYSGRTGKELRSIRGEVPGDRFGAGLASVGDFDGDRVRDLAIGEPEFKDASGMKAGRVGIFSCGTGARISTIEAGDASGGFGRCVARGGVRKEGDREVLVGAAGGGGGASTVSLFAGKEPSRVWESRGVADMASLGRSLCLWRDFDGDGSRDVVAGAPHAGERGKVLLLSGKDGATLREIGTSDPQPK